VVADAWNADSVTNRIASLVERARQSGIAVVWVRHGDEDLVAGSKGWQIVSQLLPLPGESIVEKHFGDSFEDTNLDQVLADLNVRRLVVCGMQSDGCILATLFGGFVRGYDMTLVGDAHTTNDRTKFGVPSPVADIITLINFLWAHRSAPGRAASVVDSESVRF
jgi:nicotinamidase-related amidase